MQDKYVSKQYLQTYFTEKKFDASRAENLVNDLAAKGYTIEGFNDQPKLKDNTQLDAAIKKQSGTGLMQSISDVGTGMSQAKSLSEVGKILGRGVLRSGGAVAGAALDTAGQAVSAVAKGTDNALGNMPSNALKAGGEAFLATETGKKALSTLQQGVETYDAFKQANPEAAKDLEAAVNIAEFIPMAKLTSMATKASIKGAQKAGEVAVNVGKATGKGASKIVSSVTSPINSENIMQNVARIPKTQQAKFEQLAGESVGSFLDKRGIYGNEEEILTKLYNNFSTSKGNADKALSALQGTFNPTGVKTALKDLVGKFERVSSEGAIDPNLPKAKELLDKMEKDGLTMSEINEVKRLYEKNVKLDFLKENSPEGIKKAVNIDNAIREWQFAKAQELGLQNLPEINKETMLNKQLLDALGKELAGSAGNNPVSLTDWVMLSGGDPTAIGGYLTKKVLSSKKVQSKIAEKMSKNKTKITTPEPKFK